MCERFPALDPFAIRRKRAAEFFKIAANVADYDLKHQKSKNKPKKIMKPAGDDWF